MQNINNQLIDRFLMASDISRTFRTRTSLIISKKNYMNEERTRMILSATGNEAYVDPAC